MTAPSIPQDPTLQQVFDHVARHLLRQGVQCSIDGHGALRLDGRRCAIGCLISDATFDLLDVHPYGNEMSMVVQAAVAEDIGVDFLHGETVELLGELRCLHDHAPPSRWPERLASVARGWGFDPSVVEEVRS